MVMVVTPAFKLIAHGGEAKEADCKGQTSFHTPRQTFPRIANSRPYLF